MKQNASTEKEIHALAIMRKLHWSDEQRCEIARAVAKQFPEAGMVELQDRFFTEVIALHPGLVAKAQIRSGKLRSTRGS